MIAQTDGSSHNQINIRVTAQPDAISCL